MRGGKSRSIESHRSAGAGGNSLFTQGVGKYEVLQWLELAQTHQLSTGVRLLQRVSSVL